MKNQSLKKLHMRRVREYFAQSPQLHPDTVDIVLRSHLHVPEELMDQARAEAQASQLSHAA